MRSQHFGLLIVIGFVFVTQLQLNAQTAVETNNDRWGDQFVIPREHRHDWQFTTKEYKQKATSLLLGEVNNMAHELDLPEHFPITSNDIIWLHIPPPALGMLGALTTSNYTYYVNTGRKFSGLDRRDLTGSFYELKSRYLLPLDLRDTNAAFKAGLAIMVKAGFDVAALNCDCQIEITASGPFGDKFLPDYWITWNKGGQRIGLLEYFASTQSIREMHVWDASYIMRKPVDFPNLGRILRNGNAPEFLLKKMGLDDSRGFTNGVLKGSPSDVTTNRAK